jgi:hypothetical protein
MSGMAKGGRSRLHTSGEKRFDVLFIASSSQSLEPPKTRSYSSSHSNIDITQPYIDLRQAMLKVTVELV